MALSHDELQAIRTRATCFQAGTYGASRDHMTPTAVVAAHRGAVFDEAHTQLGAHLSPHGCADHAICDQAVWDILRAVGCVDRVSYAELLETLGAQILERLPHAAHA